MSEKDWGDFFADPTRSHRQSLEKMLKECLQAFRKKLRNITRNSSGSDPKDSLQDWASNQVGPRQQSPCPINCLAEVRTLFPGENVRDLSLETRTFPAGRPGESTRMYLLYFRLKVRFSGRDPVEVEAGAEEPRFATNSD